VSFASKLRTAYDVIVIGAGPAGLAAASTSAEAGLTTLLLDENQAPGGQIYRAITFSPLKNSPVLGQDYEAGINLVSSCEKSGADYVAGCTVWSLDRERVVGISRDGEARLIKAERVIIATGALERPFPIPGWTLPGVMTIGAGQTLLKSSGLIPEGRMVLAGQGPLLWLYAAQVLRAGGTIEAICDTTPLKNYIDAAPYLPSFLLSKYWMKGLGLIREVKRKVKIINGITKLSAEGEGKVKRLVWQAGGRSGAIDADVVMLHQGVVPHVNLAMAAGVKHEWDNVQACFRPVLDESGNTNVHGIMIAGDGAGIGGAESAAERGRLAAIDSVSALHPDALSKVPARDNVRNALAKSMLGRKFLDLLYRPTKPFRIPQDDATIVCRCEEITAGEIRASVAIGATGPNQLKSYRRTGMGPCQGRLCGLTVTELLAYERGKTPDEIGYYRLRSPVKPISLAELASMPQDDVAIKAVVRG
jgi:thioredoxin reductase